MSKISMKYKGRSYSSGKSLAKAMEQDMQRDFESQIRSVANRTGVKVTKTSQGFKFIGSNEQIARLNRQIGR